MSESDAAAGAPRLRSPARLRIVDLGTGMAAALVAKLFADAGATVDRCAPDGDEVFDEVYPAHRFWRSRERALASTDLAGALAAADVCIVGGEDHPEVTTRRDAEALAARYPHLIVVDMPGYVAGDAPGAQAVDLLVQARSGLAFEHYSKRPLCFAVPFPTFGQTLLATYGAWAALLERLDSGRGQLVTASLHQGAALFPAPLWLAAERPSQEFNKVTPKDVKHLIFECADGSFVQFVMGVPRARQKLYEVLDIPVEADPNDRGVPALGTPAANFFGDLELIGSYAIKMQRDDIVRAAQAIGLPVAPVLKPGQFWDDEQVALNGVLRIVDGVVSVGSPIGCQAVVTADPESTSQSARLVRAPTGGVLDGVVILDFGAFVAGPFASRLLADLGATVIKIESPDGDPNRGLQRNFIASQMGKQDIVLDAKTDLGKQAVRRLLAAADIITHNFRRGVAERLGLDGASARTVNPNAMTLHTMAFGPAGPRSAEPGFDMVLQALLGIERRAGGPDAEPLWYRTPLLDYATGAIGAIAVLMAQYELRTEQRASDVWVSILNSGMFLMADVIKDASGALVGCPTLDGDQLGTHPAERFYQSADGWLAIVARNDAQSSALWAHLLDGEPQPRDQWDESVSHRIAKATSSRTTADLVHGLEAAGVWTAQCTPDAMQQMLRSVAGRESGWITQRPDEQYGHLYGPVGSLVSLERGAAPAASLLGAPLRGRHTRDVLGRLGYSAEQIDRLYATGVVE